MLTVGSKVRTNATYLDTMKRRYLACRLPEWKSRIEGVIGHVVILTPTHVDVDFGVPVNPKKPNLGTMWLLPIAEVDVVEGI